MRTEENHVRTELKQRTGEKRTKAEVYTYKKFQLLRDKFIPCICGDVSVKFYISNVYIDRKPSLA